MLNVECRMFNVQCSMLHAKADLWLLRFIQHCFMPKNVTKPPPGDRPLKTLERVLSKAGLGSRTEARSWIGGGRGSGNGRVIPEPDARIARERAVVAFDRTPLP